MPDSQAATPPTLLLASASPRRRELLASLGVEARLCPTHVAEWEDPAGDPVTMVLHNARIKAATAATAAPAGSIILAADTSVALADTVLNKPADLAEARAMLRLLSGRTHRVVTAVVVAGPGVNETRERIVESQVTFRDLDDSVINRYLTLINPLDKAGAYAIQTGGGLVVASWSGSYTNIVGLPLAATAAMLLEVGIRVGPIPPEPIPPAAPPASLASR